MNKVTILIPTCNRPKFLKTALESVQRQTALSHVAEVVVIENGGNRSSEHICKMFPLLPIRYVFRALPIPPEHTARPAFNEVHSELMAILFDDDWWGPCHLDSALSALSKHSLASAYFGEVFFTAGEGGWIHGLYSSWVAWFATSGRRHDGLHICCEADLLIAVLLMAPFHYSSVVARSKVWEKCLCVFDYGNPLDTDRLVALELSKHGAVLFDPYPKVYVRQHGGQEVVRIKASGEAQAWWDDSTRRILEWAKESRLNVGKEFADRMVATGVDIKMLISRSTFGSMEFLVNACLLPPDHVRKAKKLMRWARWRKWIPEGCLSWARLCRGLIRGK